MGLWGRHRELRRQHLAGWPLDLVKPAVLTAPVRFVTPGLWRHGGKCAALTYGRLGADWYGPSSVPALTTRGTARSSLQCPYMPTQMVLASHTRPR